MNLPTAPTPESNPLFKVTTLSKSLALLIFVALPLVFLYVGYQWAESQFEDSIVEVQSSTSSSRGKNTEDVFPGIKVVWGDSPSMYRVFETPRQRSDTMKTYTLYNAYLGSFIEIGSAEEIKVQKWGLLLRNGPVVSAVYLDDTSPYGGIVANTSEMISFDWNDDESIKIYKNDGTTLIIPIERISLIDL